ncbi:hypothetical protein HD553DRAFT_318071 [Filobasidium floriforme]|uniref:uncharacterized protein n=1 Tax=Filobasidium floriforme TaxID=5210 RepID=UPI001E8E34BE|nr:uncharacterized protein HD553DRAFT_318071 [Filobasidium floriforme]KAH8079980.1 hypothetical protein HD553DRAFT_318071 [Filobasidium floriforme]
MKRARSSSAASSISSSSAGSTSQPLTSKYRRTDLLPQPTDSHLTCQLPPTCSDSPNTFNSTSELQTHYSHCHLHGCQAEACNKVFPDARLLELHEIENHDPFSSEQQRAGQKIFECFLPRDVCGKRCSTPRGRRNHMIQIHHFSKQYFFSVTNHGVSPQHAYRQPENHDANGMNCCYRSGIWSSVLDPERV